MYSRKPRLQGVFPVLKPAGITSSSLLEMIKASLGNRFRPKMGHGGTLDKSAKGVLGINSGCSKLPSFLDGDKMYRFTCRLGQATNTYNADGQITMEKPYDHITLEKLQLAMEPFKGKILQKPPAYSALKKDGKRLSDLVMMGEEVNPDPRWVQCNELKVVDFSPPNLIFDLVCGRGFYVRSLVHDLGLSLDSCAHVTELERTRQGPFTTRHCLTGEQFTAEEIEQAIDDCEPLLTKYLDVQMEKYRQKQGLPPRKKTNPRRPPEQWTIRD